MVRTSFDFKFFNYQTAGNTKTMFHQVRWQRVVTRYMVAQCNIQFICLFHYHINLAGHISTVVHHTFVPTLKFIMIQRTQSGPSHAEASSDLRDCSQGRKLASVLKWSDSWMGRLAIQFDHCRRHSPAGRRLSNTQGILGNLVRCLRETCRDVRFASLHSSLVINR